MPAPSDVLDFIDWVLGLLWWEEIRSRLDDGRRWQSDMSWLEMEACIGVEPGTFSAKLAPGEWIANVDLAIEMYWPGLPPGPSDAVPTIPRARDRDARRARS